jgi:hypothetical protein
MTRRLVMLALGAVLAFGAVLELACGVSDRTTHAGGPGPSAPAADLAVPDLPAGFEIEDADPSASPTLTR